MIASKFVRSLTPEAPIAASTPERITPFVVITILVRCTLFQPLPRPGTPGCTHAAATTARRHGRHQDSEFDGQPTGWKNLVRDPRVPQRWLAGARQLAPVGRYVTAAAWRTNVVREHAD